MAKTRIYTPLDAFCMDVLFVVDVRREKPMMDLGVSVTAEDELAMIILTWT